MKTILIASGLGFFSVCCGAGSGQVVPPNVGLTAAPADDVPQPATTQPVANEGTRTQSPWPQAGDPHARRVPYAPYDPSPCEGGGDAMFLDGDADAPLHPSQAQYRGITIDAHGSQSHDGVGLDIHVPGFREWSIAFVAPRGEAFTTRDYLAARGYAQGGATMRIAAGNGACGEVIARFRVHELAWDGSTATRFTATFELQCEGRNATLRGCVHHEGAAQPQTVPASPRSASLPSAEAAPQRTTDLQVAAEAVRKRFAKRPIHVTVASGTVKGAELRAVATILRRDLQPALTVCYGNELGANANAAGMVRLRISVGATGAVTDIQTTAMDHTGGANTGPSALSGALIECARSQTRALHFDAPRTGNATVDVIATFRRTDGKTIDVSY